MPWKTLYTGCIWKEFFMNNKSSIPYSLWVQKTINKMEENRVDDKKSWDMYWYKSYEELGGKSESTGTKGCPKKAAYGLWYLGYVSNTNRPFKNLSIQKINDEFSKNVAYAVLAVDLLNKGWKSNNITSLWQEVKNQYRNTLKKEPAKSNQGAVTVAVQLFQEGRIQN